MNRYTGKLLQAGLLPTLFGVGANIATSGSGSDGIAYATRDTAVRDRSRPEYDCRAHAGPDHLEQSRTGNIVLFELDLPFEAVSNVRYEKPRVRLPARLCAVATAWIIC